MRPVLEALSSRGLFVVLGAGAQIPILSATVQMPRTLRRNRNHFVPWFPVNELPLQSPLRSRLWKVSDPRYNRADESSVSLAEREERRRDQLLDHVHNAEISLLFRHELDDGHTRAIGGSANPECERLPVANHRIFYYVPSPAFIFDFNCDGIVSSYCSPPHVVVNPHGYINHIWKDPERAKLLHQYAAYGGLLPNSKLFVEPGPESKTITQIREYVTAAWYLSQPGRFILLIGYSFGLQPDGSIDDAESFEFLCEHLKRFKRQIIVVDPRPEHVAGLFEQALGQRTYACKLYWNYFAKAVCCAIERSSQVSVNLALQDSVRRVYNGLTLGCIFEISG